MAVPEGERRPCKMDVFMYELDLVTYTLRITRNEKIFLPEYKGCITDDIVETAKNIYMTSRKNCSGINWTIGCISKLKLFLMDSTQVTWDIIPAVKWSR